MAFAKKVVEQLGKKTGRPVSPKGMQYGMVVFSREAKVVFYLNESSSEVDVRKLIDSALYTPGITNTYELVCNWKDCPFLHCITRTPLGDCIKLTVKC